MKFIKALILFSIAVCMFFSCKEKEEAIKKQTTTTDVIKIGALYSYNQNGYIHGETIAAAIDLAVANLNTFFSENGINKTLEIVSADTENDLTTAVNKLNELIANDIKVILTSTSSGDLELLKPIAEENGVVLISQTSTSPSLSVADNIFRFVPDDAKMAKVFAKLESNEGIKKAFIINRNDIWGNDLSELLLTEFESKQINSEILASYDARIVGSDFDTILSKLVQQVNQALTAFDTAEIAINFISLDEGVEFISVAKEHSILSKVKWYGSDGIVHNQELLDNAEAASFASKVGFLSPIIAENSQTNYQEIKTTIETEANKAAYSYAVYMYDVVMIAGKAYNEMGSTFDLSSFMEKLSSVSSSNTGIFGSIELNDAGDIQSYPYDFWKVEQQGSDFIWTKELAEQTE